MADSATVTYPTGDQSERRFERIIGNSAALESVLDQVEQVAPTDSTVLIEPARVAHRTACRRARQCGLSEVQYFCRARLAQEDICRLDVAVNDVLVVGSLQSVGDLRRDV